MWDAAFDDLVLDWNIDSSHVINSDRLLDHDRDVVIGDVSPLFQELMQDANNLSDELLLSESAVLLGQGEPSLPSWSLSEAFAFVAPYKTPLPRNVGLILHRHHDDQRFVASTDELLVNESLGGFQIWLGE